MPEFQREEGAQTFLGTEPQLQEPAEPAQPN